MPFHTDNIYTVSEPDLVPRSGALDIVAHPDAAAPERRTSLVVAHGLMPGDLAVFLTYIDNTERDPSIGYLVTDINRKPGGSGTLMRTETICARPNLYVTKRLYTTVRLLGDTGLQAFERMGVSDLLDYIHSTPPPESK